jgi:hypothetical protein
MKTNMDILDKYDLKEWWNTSLTPEQRNQIARDYQPMGFILGVPYLYAKIVGNDNCETGKCCFLDVLACVATDGAKVIVANKTEVTVKEALNQPRKNFKDIHLALTGLIKHYYRQRDDQAHYQKAKELCWLQISISTHAAKTFSKPIQPKGISLKKLEGILGRKLAGYGTPQTLPSHVGYKQMAIILEKEGDLEGAIKLSQKALKQGWTDNYDKRIVKLAAKLARRK